MSEQIARVCHEANRAYCASIGDHSQKPWDEAEQWQRDAALQGVLTAIAGANRQQMHEDWVNYKLNSGWTYGPVKDPDHKQHPCLVPYAELPETEKKKDTLFLSIVEALK